MKKIIPLLLILASVWACSKNENNPDGPDSAPTRTAESITIEKITADNPYQPGDVIEYVATVTPADSKDSLCWHIDGEDNIILLETDELGRKVKYSVKAAGSSYIWASSGDVKSDGLFVYTFRKTIPVEQIMLNYTDLKLKEDDGTVRLTFDTIPEDADYDSGDVRFDYDDSETSVISCYEEGGDELLIDPERVGKTTITVTVCGLSATCNVEVVSSAIPVTSIGITSTYGHNIEAFSYFGLSASISPSNATNTDVTWGISDADILERKPNADPKQMLVYAKKPGKATVTLTHTMTGTTASYEVTVTRPELPQGAVDLGCRVAGYPIYFRETVLDKYYAYGDSKLSEVNSKLVEGFKWSNCKYAVVGSDKSVTFTKYNSTDNISMLEPIDDAARTQLGDCWRTASYNNLQWLIENCEFKKTSMETVSVISNVEGYKGNKITLPTVGYVDGVDLKQYFRTERVGRNTYAIYSDAYVMSSLHGGEVVVALRYDDKSSLPYLVPLKRYQGACVLPVYSAIVY